MVASSAAGICACSRAVLLSILDLLRTASVGISYRRNFGVEISRKANYDSASTSANGSSTLL
jgi:hypothetical protein